MLRKGMFSNDQLVATVEATIVMIDEETRRSAPLKAQTRAILRDPDLDRHFTEVNCGAATHAIHNPGFHDGNQGSRPSGLRNESCDPCRLSAPPWFSGDSLGTQCPRTTSGGHCFQCNPLCPFSPSRLFALTF